jgi:hypothetical protein
MKLIAESENIVRSDRHGPGDQDTSGIHYGSEAVATKAAVVFRWGTEGGYEQGSLTIPWPEILKHTPTAALRKEILSREDSML